MLFYVLVCIWSVQGYFEQKLIRRALDYKETIDLEDIIKEEPLIECSDDVKKLNHNATYVTQLCFNKDVFYNLEVVLGENVTQDHVYEMYIDLSSPWTWFKSKDCQYCKVDPLEYDFDKSCHESISKSCFYGQFNKSYNSSKWNDVDLEGMIYSDEQLLSGQFQTDTIQLLAYNSSQGMKVSDYIKYKLGNDTPTDLVKLKGLQMLQIDVMKTQTKFAIQADGSIGLGFGYIETKEESMQKDSDFVEILIKEKTQLNLTRQQFAIYSYETGVYYPDFVIQFGGLDYKYAHRHTRDIVWINRLSTSGYYWMVELDKIGLKDLNKGTVSDEDYLLPPITKAILTLNSQFIELPYLTLIQMMKKIESMHSTTKCNLVDSDHYVLYCRNLIFPNHFQFLRMTFKFPTLNKIEEIQLSGYHLLYSKCDQHEDQTEQDCLFNIKLSQSNYVILGEPFMRQHYIIFENQPAQNGIDKIERIGILPAGTNMYYPDNSQISEWPFLRAIVYIFIFGILGMCCVSNIKRGCKDIYRAIRYRRAPMLDDHTSLRSKAVNDDEVLEYQDKITPIEVEMKDETGKQNEWNKSQNQFNFSEQFTSIVEDNSI